MNAEGGDWNTSCFTEAFPTSALGTIAMFYLDELGRFMLAVPVSLFRRINVKIRDFYFELCLREVRQWKRLQPLAGDYQSISTNLQTVHGHTPRSGIANGLAAVLCCLQENSEPGFLAPTPIILLFSRGQGQARKATLISLPPIITYPPARTHQKYDVD